MKMAIDESSLTKGQIRKLTALRKSIGDDIADEAFSKWLARQSDDKPQTDPVAQRIVEALSNLVGDGKLNLGLYGYTVRRARGKGQTGFVASRNEKPRQ